MRFIPVKKIDENKSILPFNKEFFWEIQQLFNCDIFVETGTYLGDTSEIAAQIFHQVHTVELSEELYNQACKRFSNIPNIFTYQGDSGVVLNHILAQAGTEGRIAILLDGHWSGGITACGFDVPILRGLEAIKNSGIKNSVIIIDDIRCFQNQSIHSNDPCSYPELSAVIQKIKQINFNYTCIVYGDALLSYTDQNIVIPELVQAMTISRLNEADITKLITAENSIATVSDEDFNHLSYLATIFDISTGPWRTHYYDFWYALTLYKRGNKATAYRYMRQAAALGFHRACYYLELWK